MEFPEAVKYLAERAHMQIRRSRWLRRRGAAAPVQFGTARAHLRSQRNLPPAIFIRFCGRMRARKRFHYLYKPRPKRFAISVALRPGRFASGLGYTDRHISASRALSRRCSSRPAWPSNETARYYDMFRGRVIFPIINARGKVLGFGGRGDGRRTA